MRRLTIVEADLPLFQQAPQSYFGASPFLSDLHGSVEPMDIYPTHTNVVHVLGTSK